MWADYHTLYLVAKYLLIHVLPHFKLGLQIQVYRKLLPIRT